MPFISILPAFMYPNMPQSSSWNTHLSDFSCSNVIYIFLSMCLFRVFDVYVMLPYKTYCSHDRNIFLFSGKKGKKKKKKTKILNCGETILNTLYKETCG